MNGWRIKWILGEEKKENLNPSFYRYKSFFTHLIRFDFGTIKRIASPLNNVFGCLSMYLPRESLFYMTCFEMIDLNHCITNVILCLSLNFGLQTSLSMPLWIEFRQPLRIIHNLMNPMFVLKANILCFW